PVNGSPVFTLANNPHSIGNGNFALETSTAALADGRFVVASEGEYQVYDNNSYIAELADADGAVIPGSAFQINTTPAGNPAASGYSDFAMANLADGGYAAAFTVDVNGTLEVRARTFDADGTPRGDDFLVYTVAPWLYAPRLVVQPGTTGGFNV